MIGVVFDRWRKLTIANGASAVLFFQELVNHFLRKASMPKAALSVPTYLPLRVHLQFLLFNIARSTLGLLGLRVFPASLHRFRSSVEYLPRSLNVIPRVPSTPSLTPSFLLFFRRILGLQPIKDLLSILSVILALIGTFPLVVLRVTRARCIAYFVPILRYPARFVRHSGRDVGSPFFGGAFGLSFRHPNSLALFVGELNCQ
jgi:hypothetical protein